jgi:hypothetical protein
VGSELCIRDRHSRAARLVAHAAVRILGRRALTAEAAFDA